MRKQKKNMIKIYINLTSTKRTELLDHVLHVLLIPLPAPPFAAFATHDRHISIRRPRSGRNRRHTTIERHKAADKRRLRGYVCL
jgi:hypothetical protein